jgi:hypothetical protein
MAGYIYRRIDASLSLSMTKGVRMKRLRMAKGLAPSKHPVKQKNHRVSGGFLKYILNFCKSSTYRMANSDVLALTGMLVIVLLPFTAARLEWLTVAD